MQTHNLGYPRIGSHRELKKAEEQYWAGKTAVAELAGIAKNLRLQNWQLQKETGIDLIPCNDFSFYDQMLDTILMTGAIPERFHVLLEEKQLPEIDLYFAMARGYQKGNYDITAMEMTKWFDTNYHYIVPEFVPNQKFSFLSKKIVSEFLEAKRAGYHAKPVLPGPVSFLLLGKEKEKGFNRLDLMDNLLPVYMEVLTQLEAAGARFIQIDEPCLALDLHEKEQALYIAVFNRIKKAFPHLHIMLATYFGGYGVNMETALSLPVQTLHLDMVRCPEQLDLLPDAEHINLKNKKISLGIVDGRNIWKNDFEHSLSVIRKAEEKFGTDNLWIAPSCSLLHVPCDLELETSEDNLPYKIKQWMAFAKQKIKEVVILADLASASPTKASLKALEENKQAIQKRITSNDIHNPVVKESVKKLTEADARRVSAFPERKKIQQSVFSFPLFPTTTIGSFPQTKEVRKWRADLKKGRITEKEYDTLIKAEITKAIRWQEDLEIDVPVHGEFERNDMVEYFGEQLDGFAFTKNGWVQSYGSRCVKPPVIFGDVSRKKAMTVYYTQFAQSITKKPVKGMLTGPVTILQWSFVRNDQPREDTCMQIACAIRDEVTDLEKAGIKIIQIDEPALREGLPLRKKDWQEYLNRATESFRITSSGVADSTQIHTHMCYSEFNDIIESIASMDADVITIETSRSQMELLDAFADFKYPNDIGPGVYDLHSPRIPSEDEMVSLMEKAIQVIPKEQLWINPDCGLKTRGWKETKAALENMMNAARELRKREATNN